MTVYTLGSINLDHVYRVPHLPRPGETLAVAAVSTGLGGKGANQSVAAARAGAQVEHVGAVGPDGVAAVAALAAAGVGTAHVARLAVPTGHAIIAVDDAAENLILVHAGANRAIRPPAVAAALAGAGPGDTLMLQNETSAQAEAAALARARGMRVIYSAAPFDAVAVAAVLGSASILVLNAVEAAALAAATGRAVTDLGVAEVLVTRGGAGAEWHCDGQLIRQAAFPVRAIDTTGAGDTFAGYFAAARDAGESPAAALRLAAAAAALQVTRPGAAAAIPTRAEVDAFLAERA